MTTQYEHLNEEAREDEWVDLREEYAEEQAEREERFDDGE